MVALRPPTWSTPSAGVEARQKVRWTDGRISAKTFATIRLADTYAHGLEILTSLKKEVVDTPRLRHVGSVGPRSPTHSMRPERSTTTSGLNSRTQLRPLGCSVPRTLRTSCGPAGDWCRLVVGHTDDPGALSATGDVAELALKSPASTRDAVPSGWSTSDRSRALPLPRGDRRGRREGHQRRPHTDSGGIRQRAGRELRRHPFFADDVPKATIAAMTRAVTAVAELGVPTGVNVLRNDALGALAVAAATGATFIGSPLLSG